MFTVLCGIVRAISLVADNVCLLVCVCSTILYCVVMGECVCSSYWWQLVAHPLLTGRYLWLSGKLVTLLSTDVLRHCMRVCMRACVRVCVMNAVVVVTIASVAVLVLHTQVSDCLCEWSNRDTANVGANMCCHDNTQVSEGRKRWWVYNSDVSHTVQSL